MRLYRPVPVSRLASPSATTARLRLAPQPSGTSACQVLSTTYTASPLVLSVFPSTSPLSGRAVLPRSLTVSPKRPLHAQLFPRSLMASLKLPAPLLLLSLRSPTDSPKPVLLAPPLLPLAVLSSPRFPTVSPKLVLQGPHPDLLSPRSLMVNPKPLLLSPAVPSSLRLATVSPRLPLLPVLATSLLPPALLLFSSLVLLPLATLPPVLSWLDSLASSPCYKRRFASIIIARI